MPKNSRLGGLPHYGLVPKSHDENLDFRKEILTRALPRYREHQRVRSDLMRMCAEDSLFWFNAFCWIYEPRQAVSGQPVLPFLTYPFQDDLILNIEDAIADGHDLPIVKSRDMGASWIACAVFLHKWLFKAMCSFLLLSRKEKLVEDARNSDALFWKLDFLLRGPPGGGMGARGLPGWMKPPDYERQTMMLYNPTNGSVMNGESSNVNAGAAGRRTATLIDEHARMENSHQVNAATRDTTRCRLFLSTYQGIGDGFHAMCERQRNRLIVLHWPLHPLKRKGLYTSDGGQGRIKVLDAENPPPPDYPYIADGKLRSPFYDIECARASSVQEIATELDCDPIGSAYQFFDSEGNWFPAYQADNVRTPMYVGNLVIDRHTRTVLRFDEDPQGDLRLWLPVDLHGELFHRTQFGIGIDVAFGAGASNSVLSVGDLTKAQKVAEYATAHKTPDELAEIAVAMGRWFRDRDDGPAMLIWENNGPGSAFRKKIQDFGYGNVWYSRNERSDSRKPTDTPGWSPTPENKQVLLAEYRSRLKNREFINPCGEALDECLKYIAQPNGSVAHGGAVNSIDPTGAEKNHGDRVIADALLCKLCYEVGQPNETVEQFVPEHSAEGRRRARLAKWKSDKEAWPIGKEWTGN